MRNGEYLSQYLGSRCCGKHASGFGVHLKYKETKAPRRGDRVLMEMAVEVCKHKELLLSFSWVISFLEVTFLSDITPINGKYLEMGNHEG